jgi:heme/copper-type cytochrome/quinol oxidase subunit 2
MSSEVEKIIGAVITCIIIFILIIVMFHFFAVTDEYAEEHLNDPQAKATYENVKQHTISELILLLGMPSGVVIALLYLMLKRLYVFSHQASPSTSESC